MDILLIEDEPGMRSLLQHSLESRGHAVTAVADGESGWENYQSRDFPLVILEWLLPGIDGLDVCRRIRSSPKSADSLVLVITGCTNPGDLDLALAAGVDDYLAKPVEAALLNIRLAIVEQRVNRLNQQREAARMLGTVQDITERKRAERRAKYLKDAIETISEGFAIYDADDRFVLANSKYLELYKLSAESIVEGMPFKDILKIGLKNGQYLEAIGREEEWLEERLRDHLNPGKAIEQRLPGGRWLRIAEYKMPDGSTAGLRTDITTLKNTEEALFAAKQQADETSRMLHTVLDTIPVRIFWKDRHLVYLGSNQLFARDAGKTSSQELIGKTDYELSWHAVADLYRSDDRNVIESGQSRLNFEEPQIHSDGTRTRLRTSKVPLRAADGEVIGLLGTYENITAVKQAAQEIERLRDRLQLATESAGIGIWDWDVINNSLAWDKSMFNLYGIEAEQFGGAYETWVKGLHPGDAERLSEEVRLALSGEGEQPYDTEFRAVWPNEEVRWLKAKAVVQRDENGAPTHMIGVNWDITAHKLSEQSLAVARDGAEAANLTKTRFLAAASHDLRQPIAAANLLIETLTLSSPNKRQSELLGRLKQAMSIFSLLLKGLLDISKFDAQGIKPQITSFDMVDLLLWLDQNFAEPALDKPLRFRLFFAESKSLVVRTDIVLVQSVLMNLISNAMKFTERGGILISARPRGDNVLVQVWDTGIGIAEANLPYVFDEFYQVNNPQRSREAGLGLGLSICRRAMSLLGSEVTCRSRLGRGSVFGFSLPLNAEQHEIEFLPINDTSTEAVNNMLLTGKRVVVVEDDALVAQAMVNFLEGMGGDVKCFHSAEDALHHDANIEYADYYVVDYMLGGTVNGIQFLNLLRQKLGKPIHAVLMTGDTSTNFIRNAENYDWPVLHKPVSISKLLSSLSAQAR